MSYGNSRRKLIDGEEFPDHGIHLVRRFELVEVTRTDRLANRDIRARAA